VRCRRKKADANARENQSTGNERRESSDIGCAFLENIIGRTTNPQEMEKKNMEVTWSSGVLPGSSRGIAVSNRKSGAHANGLRRGQTNGLSLCRHHPKFPTLGVVLTHGSGGGISPTLKSGGRSGLFHHPGSPSRKCRSKPASMPLGEGFGV
jgi:hypothetical protein